MTDTRLKFVLHFEKHLDSSKPRLQYFWGPAVVLEPRGDTPAAATAKFEFSQQPDDALDKRVRETLGLDWIVVQNGWTAATPLPMTPILPSEAKDLLLEAKAALEGAGVNGAEWVTEAPTGWSRIIHVFASKICNLVDRAPHDSQVRIDCVKEKFGTLRVYVGQTGLPEDLADELSNLATWAETQSYGRCMSTGRPGTNAMSEHYICTLSDEARKAREDDLEHFNRDCWPLASATHDYA
jgi:hypothetical protein